MSELRQEIQATLERRDLQARSKKRSRWTFALFAALLGPVAVGLLAVQVIAYPHGGLAATLLIGGELILLAVAVSISYLRLGRAHEQWIRLRLLTEILRRELFLLRMRVGPYLDTATTSDVQKRLLHLDRDETDVVSLIEMGDPDRGRWSDDLERRVASGETLTPIDATQLASYREQRVSNQRVWFADEYHGEFRRAHRWENAARLVLLAALLISGVHLGTLLYAHVEEGWLHVAMIVTAIALPAVGAAVVALQSILGSHRLFRSYQHHSEELEKLELRSIELERRVASDPTNAQCSVDARRLVLRTEELLSTELLFWYLVTQPEEPKAG